MTYYDEIAQGYEELHYDEQIHKLKLISESLDISHINTILDVGCGSGISTRYWEGLLGAECRRVGIDPSEKLIDIAKEKDSNAKYFVGCAEELPFNDSSFELVLSVTAIHNFSNFSKGLDEIKRVGTEKFVLTVLRKSANIEEIKELILAKFKIKKIIMEDKDIIFLI
ncbi:class I SAM-dependent methyltransferase [Candidatus Woesearchaeota archaeon]|jgi:ubiquinone/menaquinone biosynthesis C-methylase UbiE|nr:class I SAM-dependent methyltransferase [Candidatus Woesearchaeota archaeon]MBT6518636.1 class I SAM-dependent methyltransferase [Candidatus Woesearchaeota archaeon]